MSITSVIRYVQALDSTATDGSGKTGLAFGDITAKYLTQAGTLTTLTTEDITTLGTYQAPSDASHIRIKKLADTDPMKGILEVHFHNTQVAASGVKLWLFLSATGARFAPLEMDLQVLTALAVPGSQMDLVNAPNETAITAIQNGLATSTALTTVGTAAASAASASSAAATSSASADGKLTTTLARLGAWTGTGLNTILGALRAICNKAAALTPSDISAVGTFSNTADSLQAIADNGGGGGGGNPWLIALDSSYTDPQAGAILQSIESQMAVVTAIAGPGATACVIHISDPHGNPIAGAQVWLTSDQPGTTLVAGVILSNLSGNAVFLLTVGVTYYLWARKDGEADIPGIPYIATA